ncbi:MAG TPA: GtrA family protein [Candidatus Gracilibacteria bacterium]
MSLLTKLTSKHFRRFVVTGILSTILNYGVFYGLYRGLEWGYLIAAAMGYIVGLIFGYFLNKFWTFEVKTVPHFREIMGYVMVYLISLVVSLLFLHVAVEYGDLDPRLANVLAIVISTILNFVGLKWFVFKAKADHA